jgi:hypothetical protein
MSLLTSRSLTIAAAVILAFDGAALLGIGIWSGRLMLLLAGVVFFVSAGFVVLSWRWYRRRVDDIAAARSALASEAREMGRVLGRK